MASPLVPTRTRNTEDLHPDGPELSDPDEQSAFLRVGSDRSPLSEGEEEEDHAREVAAWKALPWWRRPSPYWLVFGPFFSTIGFSALLAPKVALYTDLACRVHRQEYAVDVYPLHSLSFSFTDHVSIYAVDTQISYVTDTFFAFPLNTTYALPPGYVEDGSDAEQKCASDPVVQAVVATLNAVFTASMGILSCLTAGWWGSLSDRYGRRIVLFVSSLGVFAVEFTHIITARFIDVLPGGYWFLLVGFLIEGLCGSMSSGTAASHAYLADTTDPSTRSRYFSLSLGLTFTGVAVGPVLGGLLIRSTGTMLSVFYFASILHGVYTLLVLLILPESLTRTRTRVARLRRKQEKTNQTSRSRTFVVLKSITRLLDPLIVLLPEKSVDAHQPKEKGRDWSLFLLAVAYAFVTGIQGSFPYIIQYAAAQFNWTPEITSYFVSFAGATRAFFLAAILPLIIRYFITAPVQLPSTSNEPVQGDIGASPSRSATPTNAPEQRSPASRSPAFDLALARASAASDAIAFLGMAIASTGTLFVLASTFNSLGAGFAAAAQALALDIYTNHDSQNRGEVGKLFGAFSVIQALGSQIISPGVYGFVYFKAVASFPQAIIVVSACTSMLAFISLLFVRIPSKPEVVPGDEIEQGIQDIEILFATENEMTGGH